MTRCGKHLLSKNSLKKLFALLPVRESSNCLSNLFMMKVALDIHLLRPPKLSSQNEMMGFVEYSFGTRRTQSRVLAFRISLRRMILISSLLSAPVLLFEMIPEKTDEHLFPKFPRVTIFGTYQAYQRTSYSGHLWTCTQGGSLSR